MKNLIIRLSVAFALFSLPAGAVVIEEHDGIIIMEAEDAQIGTAWSKSTQTSGYTGSGYMVSKNQNPLDWGYDAAYSALSDQNQMLRLRVYVNNPGRYFFKLRNIHPSGDSKNDCWFSVNGSRWRKVWDDGTTNMQYTWDDEYHRGMVHELRAGENLVEIASRVSGYGLDRIIAFSNMNLPQDAWDNPQHPANPVYGISQSGQTPAAPNGLVLNSAGPTVAEIQWQPVSNSDLWHYLIYIEGQLAGVTRRTKFTAVGLSEKSNLSFRIRARNQNGVESALSAQLTVTTQGITDGVDGLLLRKIITAPTIDGKPDELWLQQKKYTAARKFNAIAVQNNSLTGPNDLIANFRAAWDNQNLYFMAEIIDDIIIKDTDFKDVWWFRDDGVELLLDTKNGKQPFYGDNTFRYRFRYNDNLITEIGQPISEHNGKTSGIIDGVVMAYGTITGGYVIEAKMPWSTLKCSPAHGKLIGFEVLVTDDDDGGDADHMYAWWNGWKDEESKPVFAISLGEAKLVDPTATNAATPVKAGVKEFSIVKAAGDELKIDLDSDAIVKLQRADGRVISMQATNRGKAVIATGKLARGFYLLEVADGKRCKHQRLIIQ